jgi:hypothetical protein
MKTNTKPIIAGYIKIIVLVIALLLPSLVFCQSGKHGSVEYLKFCNGLDEIKLGSDINLIPDYKLAFLDGNDKPDADSCFKYEYRDSSLLKMGNNLNLELIAIRTYKNKIVNIYLFFKRDDAYKVLNEFSALYGVYTDKPDPYQDVYDWNSVKLNLSVRYEAKVDLGIAVFTSNSLVAEISREKQKQAARSTLFNSIASISALKPELDRLTVH